MKDCPLLAMNWCCDESILGWLGRLPTPEGGEVISGTPMDPRVDAPDPALLTGERGERDEEEE